MLTSHRAAWTYTVPFLSWREQQANVFTEPATKWALDESGFKAAHRWMLNRLSDQPLLHLKHNISVRRWSCKRPAAQSAHSGHSVRVPHLEAELWPLVDGSRLLGHHDHSHVPKLQGDLPLPLSACYGRRRQVIIPISQSLRTRHCLPHKCVLFTPHSHREKRTQGCRCSPDEV